MLFHSVSQEYFGPLRFENAESFQTKRKYDRSPDDVGTSTPSSRQDLPIPFPIEQSAAEGVFLEGIL